MSKHRKPNFNLQSLLDSHDNPFVLIDADYTIVAANEAYCNCYDTSLDEILGSKCHMVHHNSELPCHKYGEECPMQRVMETGERYEVSHVHHNREYHPEYVSIKGSPVSDEEGKHYLGEEILQAAVTSDTAGRISIHSVEARYIAQLLEQYNGHRRKVAEVLKISERTLYRKLVHYNLSDVGKK